MTDTTSTSTAPVLTAGDLAHIVAETLPANPCDVSIGGHDYAIEVDAERNGYIDATIWTRDDNDDNVEVATVRVFIVQVTP